MSFCVRSVCVRSVLCSVLGFVRSVPCWVLCGVLCQVRFHSIQKNLDATHEQPTKMVALRSSSKTK